MAKTAASAVEAETVDRLRAALMRISRRVDRQISRGELSHTQQYVLATVVIRGPIGLSELAEIERINPTMLSRVVAKLEEQGLIRRQVDQVDRRVVRVEATEEGAVLRERLLVERSAIIAERLERLPREQISALVDALPALEALVDELGPTAPGSPPAPRSAMQS